MMLGFVQGSLGLYGEYWPSNTASPYQVHTPYGVCCTDSGTWTPRLISSNFNRVESRHTQKAPCTPYKRSTAYGVCTANHYLRALAVGSGPRTIGAIHSAAPPAFNGVADTPYGEWRCSTKYKVRFTTEYLLLCIKC